jgi:hypothetical protein
MNMPGFTAEASLLNSDMHYQATTAATVYGEFVQPALFQPRFDELYVPKPIFCLRLYCPPGQGAPRVPMCFWVVGIFNWVTRSCE